MNANPRTSRCDAARLETFLCGEMSGAEEYEFTLHLDACERCRLALAEQAAEPDVWQEAAELLRPAQIAMVEASSIRNENVQIQNVLDALGPTDDPEMLGRLGGYEVSGVVGAGGMGVVLKAIDPSLDRSVAIKVLAPHLASSGSARKRFAREAKAAAAVLHPNVIAIHSVSTGEALPYLVMPYVRGPSLQKRLDREGPQSLQEILRIGAQIASGLAAAHAQGLVHRDIKPANILLEEGIERVTITDFGLARAVDDATLTHSGMIAGTPQYMSPEQARGEAVDARSDLFSLGSLLYAVCTGRPPFRAETSYGVMRRITDEEPRPIHEINTDIPRWLSQLIDKLMSKQAADRYPSAAEVAELFEACLAHVQQPTVAKLPPALQPEAGGSRVLSISRRSSGVIAMITALGLGLLGLFAWQATEAPDIAGSWSGEEWGQVVLKKTGDGEYSGAYSDTFKASPGTIKVTWSRLERRYKGNWREAKQRSGKISLRLVDNEIRGAWTTSKKSEINPGTPELADLTWKRSSGTPLSTPASTPAAEIKVKNAEIQVKFVAPTEMEIALADQRGQFGKSPPYVAPARLNLLAGKSYRLKLTNIAGREGADFYPTVEIGKTSPRSAAFLAHNSIPIQFTEEDFDQAQAGNFVTKVIYLPTLEDRERASEGVETLVSTRLDPGADPIIEAGRRGSILAVIRLGNKDTELLADEKASPDSLAKNQDDLKQAALIHPQSLNAAVKQFNEETAEVRRDLFDPPISDLTVERLREGFRQTSDLYLSQGNHEIADVLQRIAASGQLPKDASALIATGVHARDEAGRTVSRQIVPGFTLPNIRGADGLKLIVLRPLELLYRKDGPASKDYGEQFAMGDAPTAADQNSALSESLRVAIRDAKSRAIQLSEPKEVVLSMNSTKFMLDLDTGATMDPPQTIRPEQSTMEVHPNQVQPYHFPTALIGTGLWGMEMKESDWHASADAVRSALEGEGVEPLKEMDLGPEKHPTYFFRTRDGACGVLQLLEVVDKPKGIRLRYKTIEDKPSGEQRGEILTPKQIVANGQKLYHSRRRIVVRMKVAANTPITVVDEKGSQQKHWNLSDADTPEFSIRVTNDGQEALLKVGVTLFPNLFVGQWIEVEGTVQAVGRDVVSRPEIWTYHVDLSSLDQVSFPPSETSGTPAHR